MRARAEVADAAGRRPRRSCRRTTGCRSSVRRYTRSQPGRRPGRLREADYTQFQAARSILTRCRSRACPPAERAAHLHAGAGQPALAGAGLVLHAQAAGARHALHFDAPLANGATSGHAHRADLQPGQRAGVRARRHAISAAASRQTLEPRAFYVYTPFRDQSRLPNYDSARQRLQLRDASIPRTLSAATTASPTTTC